MDMDRLNDVKDQIQEALIFIEKVKNKTNKETKEYERLEQIIIRLENCLFLLE